MGTGLSHLCGIGSRIAILAETRYEWYVSYLATTNGTGIIVPLDKELPPEEVASCLNRAEVNCVIYSSSKQNVLDEIRDQIPGVTHFICMDKTEKEGVEYFYDILKKGQELLDSGDRLFLDAPLDVADDFILINSIVHSQQIIVCMFRIVTLTIDYRLARLNDDRISRSLDLRVGSTDSRNGLIQDSVRLNNGVYVAEVLHFAVYLPYC